MKYKVITEISMMKLEKKVNKLLQDGWRPLGGCSITTLETTYERVGIFYKGMSKNEYSQTLIKEDEN